MESGQSPFSSNVCASTINPPLPRDSTTKLPSFSEAMRLEGSTFSNGRASWEFSIVFVTALAAAAAAAAVGDVVVVVVVVVVVGIWGSRGGEEEEDGGPKESKK